MKIWQIMLIFILLIMINFSLAYWLVELKKQEEPEYKLEKSEWVI